MEISKPDWNPENKEKSLEEYAVWINNLARESFISDGGHPEIFFMVGEGGEIVGCRFKDGISIEKKNAAIILQARQLKVFGTIHARKATVYHPKLTGNPKTQSVRFLDSTSDDQEAMERDCLLVEMQSKSGTHKIWANPILEVAERLTLGDTTVGTLAEDF
jgi:hypothetical protein